MARLKDPSNACLIVCVVPGLEIITGFESPVLVLVLGRFMVGFIRLIIINHRTPLLNYVNHFQP
jgi:hypothetical protein